mgnify:CR=1 FL=1
MWDTRTYRLLRVALDVDFLGNVVRTISDLKILFSVLNLLFSLSHHQHAHNKLINDRECTKIHPSIEKKHTKSITGKWQVRCLKLEDLVFLRR